MLLAGARELCQVLSRVGSDRQVPGCLSGERVGGCVNECAGYKVG